LGLHVVRLVLGAPANHENYHARKRLRSTRAGISLHTRPFPRSPRKNQKSNQQV